jgi:hypothetical protein
VTGSIAEREAGAILDLCEGSKHKAFAMVESQLAVLVLRTQVVLSLSGIVITVTGFSGRAIAETGLVARISIIGGLFLVLLAAAVGVWGVLRLKWFTQTIEPDILATLRAGIELRDRKSRFLRVALALFIAGFTFYCIAIAQLLAR